MQSTGIQLRSTVKKEGTLELSLTSVPIPEPKPDEVVVRVEGSPINPSDLGLMFGAADMSTAKVSGALADPIVVTSIPPSAMKSMMGRVDQSLPVGNEGAGLPEEIERSADARIHIPMASGVESLNAAAAAAVVFYEAARQRNAVSAPNIQPSDASRPPGKS